MKPRVGLCVLMVLCGIPPLARAARQMRYEVVPVREWSLSDVGPGARSLLITYAQGSSSCTRPATASVIETDSTIIVGLRQRIVRPGPGVVCTSDLVIGTIKVRLRKPVAGRLIRQPKPGAPAALVGPERCTPRGCVKLMPRVLGLAPRDARRVVRNDGFTVRFRFITLSGPAGVPRVVRQTPRQHAVMRSHLVTLVVRR